MTLRVNLDLRWNSSRPLPIIVQEEASECGLACLAMISGYWGYFLDLASMRQRFSNSQRGTTLKGLLDIADKLGLQTRPLKLNMDAIFDLKLPCVLHWGMDHFVVLKSLRRNQLEIHDPAVGKRVVSWEDASKYFTGIALELSPNSNFKKGQETRRFTLLSLIGKIIGLKRGIAQVLLLGILFQLCVLVTPFYLQWIVDEAIVTEDRDLITVLGIAYLLMTFFQSGIATLRSWLTSTLSTSLNFQWLSNTFSHLMKLPLTYFERRHLGDILSRFSSIQVIQRSLATQIAEGIIDACIMVGTLVMMLLYNVQLTAIACTAVICYVTLRFYLFRSIRNANAEQIMHMANQQTHFLESARGVQSIRLFGRLEERRIGWMNFLAEQLNAELRVTRFSISFQTANMLLFGVERVIVIWIAALFVIETGFSMGMLFAFVSYRDQFSQRAVALIDKLLDLRMLKLHGERVADIVFTETEEIGQNFHSDPKAIEPHIELRNVSFRYAENEPYILQKLNLVIPAGQSIAITGRSGCGKTTLIKLILGLLRPTEGEILVSGIKIDTLGLADYRSLLGTVMQDDHIFTGTIADNISFFDPHANQNHIEESAKLAAVYSEIVALPMRFHTRISDTGIGMSGGQRQRILLARALYKEPRILILDEATSHLDILNEKLVNTAIAQIQMTRIIIAHRPETIAMAERVVVLDNGKLDDDVQRRIANG